MWGEGGERTAPCMSGSDLQQSGSQAQQPVSERADGSPIEVHFHDLVKRSVGPSCERRDAPATYVALTVARGRQTAHDPSLILVFVLFLR